MVKVAKLATFLRSKLIFLPNILDGIKSCPLYGIDMEVKANNELNCL